MKFTRQGRRAAGVVLAAALGFAASGQAGPSLKDILAGNLASAGGRAVLDRVRNLSFEAGGDRYVVSRNGELKILRGREPVVTEVVLATLGGARRNVYGTVGEVTGPEKAVYEVLAGLYAGLFSLEKFEERLALKGLETFGPEKLYHLACSSAIGGCDVDFFVRPQDFRLKRLVVRGSTPEGDVFEMNTDFPPFEEAEGLSMPMSWFQSQVGTRGMLVEVTDVKTNLPLEKGYFSELEVNMGTTEARPGFLAGNVLEVRRSRGGTMIVTNWTQKDVELAGFKTGEELKLTLGDEGREAAATAVFYAEPESVPAPGEAGGRPCLIAPGPRGGPTCVIRPGGPEGSRLAGSAQPLTPLRAEREHT